MSEFPVEFYTEMKRISFSIQNFENDSADKSSRALKAQYEMVDLLKSIKSEIEQMRSLNNRLMSIQGELDSIKNRLGWLSTFLAIVAAIIINHLGINVWG